VFHPINFKSVILI